MDRLRTRSELNGFFWGALFIGLGGVVACGDPSCPAGSVSVSGRCEPAETSCPAGQVLEGGRCIADGTESDAGADAEVKADGSVSDGSMDSDAMVTESEDPLCDALDCGDHGACLVVDDQAACKCDRGFTGELCDACEGDLVLEGDACVTLCESEDAPYCGDNGSCVEVDGAAECECVHPHAGFECGECAEGFALQSDGTCEPDCGECGPHAFCNEELMTPSCECVAGYAMQAELCIWSGDGTTGGIVDGDLEIPDAWQREYVAFEGGTVTFENVMVGGACKLGSLEQSIRMPERSDAEPLVLEIQARATCTVSQADSCPALLVDIGDTLTRLPMAGGSSPVNGTLTVCLGDAAFGPETLLRIRPGLAMAGTTVAGCGAPWPELQRIAIRPANAAECPADGTTLGQLSSGDGWTTEGDSEITGGMLQLAEIDPAHTLVSVPGEGSYAVKVTTSEPLFTSVLLDGLSFQQGLPSATSTICLPAWTRGSVHSLGFKVFLGSANITALSVESSSSCDGEFDEGFERPLGSGSWAPSFAQASVETYASAHSPTRAWRVPSAQTLLGGLLLMPRPGDGMAPIFSVWTRVGAPNMSGTLVINGGGLSSHQITTTATSFGRSVVCLGEEWAGQPIPILVSGTSRMTGSVSGTPALWVDDMGPATIDAETCD